MLQNNKLRKIIALILIQLFICSNFCWAAAGDSFLAPSIKISSESIRDRFSSASIRPTRNLPPLSATPSIFELVDPDQAKEPLYYAENIEDIRKQLYPRSIWNSAQIKFLMFVGNHNKWIEDYEEYLDEGEKDLFIKVDLHLVDYILNTIMVGDHLDVVLKREGGYERLYQEIIDIAILVQKFSENPDKNYFHVSNPSGVGHTEILSVMKHDADINVIAISENYLGAKKLDYSEHTGNFFGRTLHYGTLGLYEGTLAAGGPLALRDVEKNFPKKDDYVLIHTTETRDAHEKIAKKLRRIHDRNKIIVHPTEEQITQLNSARLEVKGNPLDEALGTSAINGTIVVADVEEELVPLPYTPKNLEDEIKNFNAKVKDILSTLDDEEELSHMDLAKIKEIIILSQAYAVQNSIQHDKTPVGFFVKDVIEKMRILLSRNEMTLFTYTKSTAQKIVKAIYPLEIHKAPEDAIAHKDEVEIEKIIMKMHDDFTSNDPMVEQLVQLMLADLAEKVRTFLRIDNDSTVTEALYRSVASPMDNILNIDKATAPEYGNIYDAQKEMIGSVNQIIRIWLKKIGEPVPQKRITLRSEAKDDEPFILVLSGPLLNVLEYHQLREQYPNMQAMVILHQPDERLGKHYEIAAQEEGFTILTGATLSDDEHQYALLDVLGEGGQEAIIYTDKHNLVLLHPNHNERWNDVVSFQNYKSREKAEQYYYASGIGQPTTFKEGTKKMLVLSNFDSLDPAAARELKALGIEGIGLFRTEYAYMGRSRPLSEDEWFEHLSNLIDLSDIRIANIRLPDRIIGTLARGDDRDSPAFGPSDKQNIDYLLWDVAENPQNITGVHDVTMPLLRAIMRLHVKYKDPEKVKQKGEKLIRALFPMVSNNAHRTRILELIEQAKKALQSNTELKISKEDLDDFQVGSMIETPEGVDNRNQFTDAFWNVGTNDLAIESDEKSFYVTLTPLRFRQLRLLAETAKQKGLTLCVCGALAAKPEFLLFAAWLNSKGYAIYPSVGRKEIGFVKKFIEHIGTEELKTLEETFQRLQKSFSIIDRLDNHANKLIIHQHLAPIARKIRAKIKKEIEPIYHQIVFRPDQPLPPLSPQSITMPANELVGSAI